MQFADFKLAYGLDSAVVDQLFLSIWELACERDSNINHERPPITKLKNPGDHAVEWRLCYWIKNIYGMIDAAHAINRAAYEVAQQHRVGLNTPLTHQVAGERVVGD
ncbi:MAG: hypothetical protein ACI915_000508 [Gammaproteobacteria bacterium]|jgi:hypothetical protein